MNDIEEPIGSMSSSGEIPTLQEIAEAAGHTPKGVPMPRRLNVFLEGGDYEHSLFTNDEWDFLHSVLGYERLMGLSGRVFTAEQLADLKAYINDALVKESLNASST